MKDENLCRTQAVFSIEGGIESDLERTFASHYVILYGDIINKSWNVFVNSPVLN